MKMRKGFFLSFLILSFVQVLSVLALEDLLEDQDLKVSKHLVEMMEIEGPNIKETMKNNAEDLTAKQDSVFPEKSQKPKGSYGGANLAHRRPGKKSAAPILKSSSILVATYTMCISLFFLPFFRVCIF